MDDYTMPSWDDLATFFLEWSDIPRLYDDGTITEVWENYLRNWTFTTEEIAELKGIAYRIYPRIYVDSTLFTDDELHNKFMYDMLEELKWFDDYYGLGAIDWLETNLWVETLIQLFAEEFDNYAIYKDDGTLELDGMNYGYWVVERFKELFD
jgi:hypothetical protein